MKRGDLYIVREPGSIASNARPCLVVQSELALPALVYVTMCPVTSHLRGIPQIRIPIAPDADNGLERLSEVEVDLIETVKVANLGPLIGHAGPGVMRRVDDALRRWLDL